MRQIKFRGLRVDGKGWVVGSLLGPHAGNKSTYIIGCNGSDFEVKPETVGQLWSPSIGLEFYGGDLFKAICSVDDAGEGDGLKKKERTVKITETQKGFSVSVWHLDNWWAYRTMDFTTFKPIGNIHTP
jgi:hypothetical protein